MSEAQPKVDKLAEEEAAPFGVAITEAGSRERYALKCDDTFAVIDAHGDINADGRGSDGLFHADTRYLSHLRLAIWSVDPLLLGSSLSQDGTYARADLTNPDIVRDGHVVVAKEQIHIERAFYVDAGGLRQRLILSNYGQSPIDIPVTIGFDNDFADIFEVRGTARSRRGKRSVQLYPPAEVTLRYRGLDDVLRTARVAFSTPPHRLTGNTAEFRIALPSKAQEILELDVRIGDASLSHAKTFLSGLVAVRKEAARRARLCEVRTGNAEADAILRRAAADVGLLMTRTPAGLYPYAGVPWFSTAFGRDGMITALELLLVEPKLAKGVLQFLAAHQATSVDAHADCEPGKILHEMRGGEMAARKEVPFGRYYGSVDSTPLFVLLAGRYWERTADHDLLRALWPNIEAALLWIDTWGDRDGDGFVEYDRAAQSGLANQGWKDSGDSIFHADGSLCHGPIALVEVQAYVYEAKTLAARMAHSLGHTAHAEELERQAATLKQRFETAFWSDEIGCYALALDGDKRPCLALSSNAGQVLRSGIAHRDRAAKVAAAMLSPAMFSGWGIRTLAHGQVRYNPMSYHNGSIWPHDNALIASGLARIDRSGVELLLKAQLDAATHMHQQRLPELFCGFPRRRARAPVLYPVACSPQAWSSGALFQMLQALLGIEIDGHSRRVRIAGGRLPAWLGHVTLKGLAVGEAECSLRIQNGPHGAAEVVVLENTAGLEICTGERVSAGE